MCTKGVHCGGAYLAAVGRALVVVLVLGSDRDGVHLVRVGVRVGVRVRVSVIVRAGLGLVKVIGEYWSYVSK